jgi:hypothetical protein
MRRPHELTPSDFPFAPRPFAASPSDLDELVALCRTGKLYEVEDWIRAGKPLQWQQTKDRRIRAKHTPLQIALEHRFHSLAALLLANGYDPNADGRWYLHNAVRRKALDLVDLLLRFGTDPRSVALSYVLESCDPVIIERFLAAGLDPCADNAMADALRTRKPPLLGFVKRNRERFPGLQHQVDLALHALVTAADERGVTMMLFVGANPHAPLGEELSRLPPHTALSESLLGDRRAHLRPKLMARPIPPEQVPDLFRIAALSRDPKVVERLLFLGADPNDRQEGEHILRSFVWALTSWSELRLDEVRSGLAALAVVLTAGARVEFNDEELSALRSTLRKASSRAARGVLELFKQHGLLDDDALREVTRTDAMKRLVNRPGTRPLRAK